MPTLQETIQLVRKRRLASSGKFPPLSSFAGGQPTATSTTTQTTTPQTITTKAPSKSLLVRGVQQIPEATFQGVQLAKPVIKKEIQKARIISRLPVKEQVEAQAKRTMDLLKFVGIGGAKLAREIFLTGPAVIGKTVQEGILDIINAPTESLFTERKIKLEEKIFGRKLTTAQEFKGEVKKFVGEREALPIERKLLPLLAVPALLAVESPFGGQFKAIKGILREGGEKVAKELAQKKLVFEASQLTKKDLIDITAGRLTSGKKFDTLQAMNSDPNLRKKLSDIVRNKEVPTTQKIEDFFLRKAEALKTKKPVKTKALRGAIRDVRKPVVSKELGFQAQEAEKIRELSILNQKIKNFHLRKTGTNLTEGQRILKAKEFNQQVKILEEEIFQIGKKPTISKDLQPLAKEARKFKSAEEFVRKQPVVYHGSPTPLKQFSSKKGGVFFTDEYADATGFAGTPDNVYEGVLNFKNPLVINAKGAKWDNLNTKWGKSTQEVVSNAEKEGYDGVTFKNIVDNIGDTEGVGGESTIHFAFKPQDSFLSESQLIDIFNQAKKVEKPIAKDIGVRKIAEAKGLGVAPSPVSKAQTKSIGQGVETKLPKESPLKAEVSQELQTSEIVSSLPPSNQIPTTKSISKEFADYKKAESGVRGAWVKIRETVQDSFIRVRKLQDRVNKGAKVPDDVNVSQARTLFDGRVNTQLEEVRDVVVKIDKEIVTTAKELNLSADKFGNEIDSFLHARHAIERNAQLGDGAAGLTNSEAKKILNNIDNLPDSVEVKAVAEKIQDLNRQTLQILLDSEVIEQKLFDLLNKTYKNHIPLQRVISESEDIVQVLSGRGLDVRSTGIKRAVGSDKEVADILTNITANMEQAVIRAEKNLVDLTTLRFARENKELGLFEEIKPKVIGQTFDEKFIKEQITDPLVLTLREKGKPIFLKINDKQLAVALKGVNVEHVPSLMRGITYITRLYASLHTRFNYEFAFSNNVRDVQEMMVDVASRKGMGFGAAGKALRKDPQSKKAIFDFLMGKDTEGAKLYRQMKNDGGTTGGLGLSTREQVELDIEAIRKLNRSKPRQAAFKAIETIDKWNTLFEDATRLSVYRTALERGLSRKEAAFLAKESTVNFNKKGTAGPIINGLYMFSNASIQGSTKILRAMKNPKVLGAVVAAVGGAIYAVNEWNDDVDPDWRNKITKWDRSSNLTIMLPTEGEDVKYITVPISWGLKPIKVSLEYIYDASTGHGNLKDATTGVLTSVMESYNPLAGDESVLNTLTPTILKVPMEISRNRAWYGNSIKPDYDPSIPESAKYFKSLENSLSGRAAIATTNKISEVTDGAIEISPADVNYAYNQYIGGAGRSISRIIDTIVAATTDKELEAKERPILNRFLKETDEEQVLQRLYYSEKEKVDKEKAKQKNLDVKRITPIYDTAQMLLSEGRNKEAQTIVDNLSDADYKIYKNMKASDKRSQTKSKQIQMFRVVEDVQKLLKQGKDSEAQAVVDAMTDEEFKAYEAVKKQLGI